MTIVEWTDRAVIDLEEIDDRWSAYDVDAAERVAGQIEAAASFLTTMPQAGPALRRKDVRKWRVAATPYLLIYRVKSGGIEVLRVRHERENWTDS